VRLPQLGIIDIRLDGCQALRITAKQKLGPRHTRYIARTGHVNKRTDYLDY
jgi:hypothetical protein